MDEAGRRKAEADNRAFALLLLRQPPIDRVTHEQIEKRITEVTFHRMGETITVCHMTLDNGFSVRGESGCVDPRNYDQEIGERIARARAFDKLWSLFGFLLAEKRFDRQEAAGPTPPPTARPHADGTATPRRPAQ